MSFERALETGDLDTAHAVLDELAATPGHGGLYLPECYGDLAQRFAEHGRYDDAIAAQQRAIDTGWRGRPDPRSDIAEFHLRAGRGDEAAHLWAQLEAETPDDVWLYNAAGLSYREQGDYERAIQRWPSLAEDWADVAHPDYCRRIEAHLKWLRAGGAPMRAVAPIELDHYLPWCEERAEDPEQARAAYAADAFRREHAIPWPPARNEPCWCGSERKYKKCCGPVDAAPMHGAPDG